MKISKTAVTQTASGTYEQGIAYQVGEKVRREIFVGFDRSHLSSLIRDRCRELERQ